MLDDDAELCILLIVYGPTVSIACLAQVRMLCDYDVGICEDGALRITSILRGQIRGARTDPSVHRYMLYALSRLLISRFLYSNMLQHLS